MKWCLRSLWAYLPLLASVGAGCARDRDFALVESSLAHPYASQNAMVYAPPTAPVYGVGPQGTVIAPRTAAPIVSTNPPVVQQPNATAVSMQGVPPPLSSTGQQPYYVPAATTLQQSPQSFVPLPSTSTRSAAPSTVAGVATQVGAVVPVVVSGQAGGYPVQTTGMWEPSPSTVIPPSARQATGSSFSPRDPAFGVSSSGSAGTGSSLTTSGATPLPIAVGTPVVSAVPGSPNNQGNMGGAVQPMAFMSDTGEHLRATSAAATPLANPLAGPAPNPSVPSNAVPGGLESRTQPALTPPENTMPKAVAEPLPQRNPLSTPPADLPGAGRRKSIQTPPPTSMDDDGPLPPGKLRGSTPVPPPFGEKELEAPSASPPRSPSTSDPNRSKLKEKATGDSPPKRTEKSSTSPDLMELPLPERPLPASQAPVFGDSKTPPGGAASKKPGTEKTNKNPAPKRTVEPPSSSFPDDEPPPPLPTK